MEIKLTRVYRIKSDLTSAQFIKQTDEMMLMYDNQLDSLDMGDAVSAAVDLYENGSLNPALIDIDIEDQVYDYVNCPDSRTLLTKEDGIYEIVPGTNEPDYKSPYELAREKILQGRDVTPCSRCKKNGMCFDDGGYSGWICPTKLHELMRDHFAGQDISFVDINGDGTQMIEMKGWTPA